MTLIDQLKLIKEENLTSFHVPGHKGHPILMDYYKDIEQVLALDLTEFPGTDDLHDPQTCIRFSQEQASSLYKSQSAYFLVNGTTCGIYSMIMAATQPGDCLLVQRDCHKAVYEALFLGRVKGYGVYPQVHETGMSLGLSLESVKQAFMEHPHAKGLVLTYPNYYGIACDIEAICDYAHSLGKLVLVDGAHGAHLQLNKSLPTCPLEAGCDIVVQSSHKSLPVMTQASILHVNSDRIDRIQLERMLRLHQSSSPSYLLMSSLDIGLKIYAQEGLMRMARLLEAIDGFMEAHGKSFLQDGDLPEGFTRDRTKMVYLGLKSQKDPEDLDQQLRKKGIQLEFSNPNLAVFVTSIMNEKEDFSDLLKKMENLDLKWYSGNENTGCKLDLPVVLSISEAYYKPSHLVDLEASIGSLAKDYIIPYPPGVPLIIPGERINQELIDLIRVYIKSQQHIKGIYKSESTEFKIEIITEERE